MVNGCSKFLKDGQIPEGYYFDEDGFLNDPNGLDLCHPSLIDSSEIEVKEITSVTPGTNTDINVHTFQQHKGYNLEMAGLQKPFLFENGPMLLAVAICAVVFVFGMRRLMKPKSKSKNAKRV